MENIFTATILLCFITSLGPTFYSWKLIRKEFTEARAMLLLICVSCSMMFAYGFGLHLFGNLRNDFLQKMIDENIPNDVFTLGLSGITIIVSAMNVAISFIIKNGKRALAYSMGLVLALMMVVSILLTPVNMENPIVNFFYACCGVMAYFACILDLTYKEFCVLGNIYLQDMVMMIVALLPLVLCIRKKAPAALTATSVVNAVVHFIPFVIIAVHYWLPLEDGFDLCYHELVSAGELTGLGYIGVNLVIFVIAFIADMIWNTALYQFVKRKI